MTSALHSQLKKEAFTISLVPTLKFVGIGVMWIVLSDLALFLTQSPVSSHFPIFHLEVLKGILFVIAMGVFFFLMQQKSESLNSEIVQLDLFKKNPQAMWIFNHATMDFLEVNDAAIRLYGYTRDEFLAMKICDIRPVEDIPMLQRAMDQLQNGYRFIGDSRHFHKDGSVIHTEISAYSITYNKQLAGLIMATNNSKQINAEAALIEATKNHSKLMHDRLYELALSNKELQVRIREINANNDELIEVNKLLLHSSRSAASRYELKLQRSQNSIHAWMGNISDALWAIDLNDPQETFISEGVLTLFGCDRTLILDQPNFWELFVHANDKLRIKSELLRLNDVDQIEIRYTHCGNQNTIIQKIRLTRNEDEQVEKIFCVATASSLLAE